MMEVSFKILVMASIATDSVRSESSTREAPPSSSPAGVCVPFAKASIAAPCLLSGSLPKSSSTFSAAIFTMSARYSIMSKFSTLSTGNSIPSSSTCERST